jgi:hypothetical protein
MKTKEDVVKILTENRFNWCESEVREGLNYVRKFRPGTPLVEIAKEFPSRWAFWWGFHVGDREIMRDKVTESEWAYTWARYIGDREIMRDRVTESEWAYKWALRFGDRELMRDRVTESEWASCWARDIGDHKLMRDKIMRDDTGGAWADWWDRHVKPESPSQFRTPTHGEVEEPDASFLMPFSEEQEDYEAGT